MPLMNRERSYSVGVARRITPLSLTVVFHSAREEHYFDASGYPGSGSQAHAHADFEKQVSQFESDCATVRQLLSKEIMPYLSDWLVTHVKGSDKAYGPFLNSRGAC
jgi:hemerythrin-like metal-binding protein